MGEKKLCVHKKWRLGWRDGMPCKNKAKYGEYCGVHSPEKKKERAAARGPTQWELDVAARKAEHERVKALESSHAELLEALLAIHETLSFYEDSEEKLEGIKNHVVLINAEPPDGDFQTMLSVAVNALAKLAMEKK